MIHFELYDIMSCEVTLSYLDQRCIKYTTFTGPHLGCTITWGPGGTSETGKPNSHPADTKFKIKIYKCKTVTAFDFKHVLVNTKINMTLD